MKIQLTLVALMIGSHVALSQGCIAIRNLTGFGQFVIPEYDEEPIKWMVNVNSRYFKSYEDFDGSRNMNTPKEDQRVNHIYVFDIAFTRMFENGWSVTVDVPITAADRTSWQEHQNDPTTKIKYTTRSFGLSDVRITAFKWLLDVSTYHKGNVQLGVGLKLPTGDYNFQDYFHKPNGKFYQAVNQSIQLGDGGTGISVELNSFYTLSKTFSVYANAFYLFNPRDQNGTYSGLQISPESIDAGATINSVPDAYTFRVGGNLTLGTLAFWTGVRWEGIPVHDLIGGSNGNRRPGQITSVEPGLNFKVRKVTYYAFLPFAIYRTTKHSIPDQILEQPTTGGFSNSMIFVGAFFKL